jgi:hypothetical protein
MAIGTATVARTNVRLLLAGHDITLAPGEAAEFDTRVPHWFGPAGDRPVEILSRKNASTSASPHDGRRTDSGTLRPANHHAGHQVM